VYLLLATNLGARLGFLVAFTGLMAFMVILTSLWVTTTSPLNTLKGRIPSWKAIEYVKDPAKAKTKEVRDIQKKGRSVNAIEEANVKGRRRRELVTIQRSPRTRPPGSGGEAEVRQVRRGHPVQDGEDVRDRREQAEPAQPRAHAQAALRGHAGV
jgi:hypothetical protein